MFATTTAWLRSQGRTAAVVKINQHRLVCSFPWNFNPIAQPPLALQPWLHQSECEPISFCEAYWKSRSRLHWKRPTTHLGHAPWPVVPSGLQGTQDNVQQELALVSRELQDRERCCSAAKLHSSSALVLRIRKESDIKMNICRLCCIRFPHLLHNLWCCRFSVEGLVSKCHCKYFTKRPLQKHTKGRFGPLGGNKRDPRLQSVYT